MSVSRTQDGDTHSKWVTELLEFESVRNRSYESRGDTIGCALYGLQHTNCGNCVSLGFNEND